MLQSLIASFTNAHSLVGSFAHAPTLNEDFHLDSHFYRVLLIASTLNGELHPKLTFDMELHIDSTFDRKFYSCSIP